MIIIKEPLTTIIFLIALIVLIIFHILLRKPKKKSKILKWLNEAFDCASEYYCIDVKPEGEGFKLVVFYDEFCTEKSPEYFIKTHKSADDILTDIIYYMQKNTQIFTQALKIELCCEDEIFNIKEDVKWKERAEF